MFIYKITNTINNKIYIGQTINLVERRMRNHFSMNRKASISAIDLAIKKYGKDSFLVETICQTNNIDNLNYLEKYFIEFYNCLSPNGYNLHTGGNNHLCSEETCEKISNSKKGVPLLKLRNRPKTEEHKEKLRLVKLGKKQTKEHAKNAALGRIDKKLKSIIAKNILTGDSIEFKGIKYALLNGFEKSGIYRSLKRTNYVYRNHIFTYKEV